MKNKKFTSFFYNDKALLVVAILAATVIWLYIAVEKNVPTTKTFYDLDVTAEGAASIEEKYGLQCYGLDNVEPSVVINGQRYVVGGENFKDSITVSVDVSKITDVGEYTLPVEAEIQDGDSSTTVTSVSPDYVSVFFDKPTEKTFDVEIQADGVTAASGYTRGEAYASPKTITVSGPSSEIKKIESVTVKLTTDVSLSKTESYNTEYEIITTDGSSLSYSKAEGSSEIEVTVPVYKTKEFGTEVIFKDAPENFESYISVTVSPQTVYGGVIDSLSDDMNSLVIPVDYSKIEPGKNVIEIPVEDVENENGCAIADDVEKFTVTVTTEDLAQKTADVGSILVTGGNYKTVNADVRTVTVMGPSSAVSSYDEDNLVLYADISSVDVQKGSAVVSLTLEEGSECWLLDSPTATVEIK